MVDDPAGAVELMAAEVEAAGGALGTADRLDGLTVDRGDWWFNLRPSNTEPLLRLNVEAPDERRLRPTGAEVQADIARLHRVLTDGPAPHGTPATTGPATDTCATPREECPMTLDPLLIDVLACPEDKGPLLYFADEDLLYNPRLHRSYEVRDGIPVMLIDEATAVDERRARPSDGQGRVRRCPDHRRGDRLVTSQGGGA